MFYLVKLKKSFWELLKNFFSCSPFSAVYKTCHLFEKQRKEGGPWFQLFCPNLDFLFLELWAHLQMYQTKTLTFDGEEKTCGWRNTWKYWKKQKGLLHLEREVSCEDYFESSPKFFAFFNLLIKEKSLMTESKRKNVEKRTMKIEHEQSNSRIQADFLTKTRKSFFNEIFYVFFLWLLFQFFLFEKWYEKFFLFFTFFVIKSY